MNIGHIVPMTNGESGENFREWVQLIIEPVGMGRISATMVENKNKRKDTEPDFILWENVTKRGDKEKFGGKTFKPRQIGGVWRKVASGSGMNFLAASIDTPLLYGGKLSFSLFETKVPEGQNPEDYFWSYDAVWQPFKKENNNNNRYSQTSDYAEPTTYTLNPNGGTIPVYNETDAYEYT